MLAEPCSGLYAEPGRNNEPLGDAVGKTTVHNLTRGGGPVGLHATVSQRQSVLPTETVLLPSGKKGGKLAPSLDGTPDGACSTDRAAPVPSYNVLPQFRRAYLCKPPVRATNISLAEPIE